MKIRLTVFICVFGLAFLSLFSIANSKEISLRETIMKVQKRLNQTYTIRSEFEQRNYIKSLNTKTFSRGSLFIKKPGKIKILYSMPQKQTFVSNKKSVWIYTPKFKQILHRKISQKKQNSNPIIFLSEKINLSNEFNISLVNNRYKKDTFWKKRKPVVLKLTPEKSNLKFSKIGVKFIRIEVDSSDYSIHIFEYTDSMGNTSRFEFLNSVENEEIKDNVFEFTIPENIDVIRY